MAPPPHVLGGGAACLAAAATVTLCVAAGLAVDDAERKTFLLAALATAAAGSCASGSLCCVHWARLVRRPPALLEGGHALRDPDAPLFAWCGGVLVAAAAFFVFLAAVMAGVPAARI